MSRLRRTVLAGVVAGLLGVSAISGASALPGGGGGDEGGDNTGDGYEVEVNVVYSGDAAPSGGGSSTVTVKVVCYWGPFREVVTNGPDAGDGTNMQKVKEYIDWGWNQPHEAGYGWVRVYGDRAKFDAAAANPQPNAQWFSPYCSVPQTDEQAIAFAGGEGLWGMALQARLFTVDNPPPANIDPEDLAIAAREVMVIDEPEIDRNPKITNGPADATFVNIPTWFWVTNPETVGSEAGTRTIRAEVEGSDVWAEVTATTGGLSIASPVGARMCEPERAMLAWTPGANDDDGCTVEFSKASVAYPMGYPVTASTEWNATWEGQDQAGNAVGGTLDPLLRAAPPVNVPVAEVQAIVGGLD